MSFGCRLRFGARFDYKAGYRFALLEHRSPVALSVLGAKFSEISGGRFLVADQEEQAYRPTWLLNREDAQTDVGADTFPEAARGLVCKLRHLGYRHGLRWYPCAGAYHTKRAA
jgi:hypothetical protein